jgi:two-component system phosphate regulon sensor histidine kinase PhoR
MTKKIFKGIFFVSCVTLLASIILIMGVLYEYFSNRMISELRSAANYLSSAVELNGADYLNNISITDGDRITWIDADGTVLFDSDTDASSMENHADREEFQEALASGSGSSSRYSSTLSEKTVYYSQRLDDGTVIRVSSTHYTVWVLLLSILQFIIIVLIIAIVLSGILAAATSKRILKPINNIDLNHPDIDEKYEEFAPLLSRLNHQNMMIENQMAELARQQEEFKTITENMSEGLLIVDQKTDVLSYNSAALHMLGAEKPAGTVSALTLNRSAAFRTAIEESLSGTHSIQNMSTGNMYCQIIANPVYHSGKVSGAVIVLLDVTEKEQLEQMRREFTANVSHELKTPLTSIYGMSELLTSGDMNKEDAADFAKSIHDESGRLISLVNDILKLSQLDEGLVHGPLVSVDLYETCKNVLEHLKSAAAVNHISLELSGEHAKVQGIPTVIEEMVYNLCDNAIKYNRPAGCVRIDVTEDGGHARLTVSDTGIGIPKEHLSRVTERFYRVDKSHSKKIGGTGLGLSIVKHAAAFHHAKLQIESTEDKGTTVTVCF